MGVDEVAAARELADAAGQELAEGHHYTEVRLKTIEHGEAFDGPYLLGLQHGDAVSCGADGDRWRLDPAPPPAAALGLGDGRDDRVGAGEQTFESRDGEIRRAKKQNTECATQGRFTGGAGGRSPAAGQASSSFRWSFLRFCT